MPPPTIAIRFPGAACAARANTGALLLSLPQLCRRDSKPLGPPVRERQALQRAQQRCPCHAPSSVDCSPNDLTSRGKSQAQTVLD